MYPLYKYIASFIFVSYAAVFGCSCSYAQSNSDTLFYKRYVVQGDSLKKLKQYDPAITHYKKALAGYQKTELWEQIALCQNKIAAIYSRKKEFPSFISYARQAYSTSVNKLHKNSIEYAKALDHLGRYAEYNKDYDKALEYYKESFQKCEALQVQKTDTRFYIISSKKLIYLYLKLNKYDEAEPYARTALAISLEYNGKHNYSTARCFINLGRVEYYQHRYREALSYFQRALEIYQLQPEKRRNEILYCYNLIAVIYDALFNPNKALEYYKRAITFISDSEGEDNVRIAILLLNVAAIDADFGNYSDAISQLEKALEIFDKNQESTINYLGDAHNNLGYTYALSANHKKSLLHYQKALFFWKKFYGNEKNSDLVLVYENIGDAYYNLKDYDLALKYNNKGVKLHRELFGNTGSHLARLLNYKGKFYTGKQDFQKSTTCFQQALEANGSEVKKSNYQNSFIALQSYLGLARTYKLLHAKKASLQFLQESIASYRKAIALIPLLRSNLDRKDQIIFSKNVKDIYAESIDVLLQLAELNSNAALLNEAFDYASNSKAFALKKSVLTSAITDVVGVPKEVISLQKTLSSKTVNVQSALLQEETAQKIKDTIRIASLREALFGLNRQQDSLVKVLAQNYPDYYRYQYDPNSIKFSEVQSQLQTKEGLLEYVVQDTVAFAFFVTKEKVQVKKITTPHLQNTIAEFRKAIIHKNTATYKKLGHELYQTLLSPMENIAAIQKLTIVPDGALWHLPFDLLHTSASDTNHPRDFPYVLKSMAVHYASASALAFTKTKEHDANNTQQCLAFSYTQHDAGAASTEKITSLSTLRNSKDDLPGTRAEIKAISSIVNGKYYYNEAANEANFKKEATKYAILHLALHGALDHENPELSKLYFSPQKDTIQDNILHNHELFAMSIPAKLVVLSACNTGTGKINKGDGIMSLGTAFRYAGTQSLLLTNWEIADHTTPQLMQYFYTNIQEGMDKATALQQAKLKYLRTTEDQLTHPIYWAGFYLLGDNSAILLESTNALPYWIVVLLIGLCIGLVFLLKSYQKKGQLSS